MDHKLIEEKLSEILLTLPIREVDENGKYIQ